MTDDERVAPEVTEEIVQTEAEKVEAPEAADSTEGQTDASPAEAEIAEDSTEKTTRHQRRKAQMEQLRQEKAELERQAAQTAERMERARKFAESTQPPKESDFIDYNEYLVARGAYAAAQELDRRSIREIETEATEAQKRMQALEDQRIHEVESSWAEQREAARQRYENFDAIVDGLGVQIPPGMGALIKASDMGSDVAYHLGMNPALARQIAAMEPLQQAMAIGRLEATVTLPKPRTQTNAPDPVTPVRPKATPGKDPSTMSMDEYMKYVESRKR